MKCVAALPPPSGAVLPGTALFYPQQSRKAWVKVWLTAWLTDFTSGAGTPSQDEQDGPELGPTRKDTLCLPVIYDSLLTSGPLCFWLPPHCQHLFPEPRMRAGQKLPHLSCIFERVLWVKKVCV